MSETLSREEFEQAVRDYPHGDAPADMILDHDAAQRKELAEALERIKEMEYESLRADGLERRIDELLQPEINALRERVKVLEEAWEEVVLAMPPGSTQRVVIDAHQRPHPLAFTQINAAGDRLNAALKEPTNG